MPFHTTDPVDTPEYVREQRRREADRVIARMPVPIGGEVEITKAMPAELALHEPSGILVGYMPTAPGHPASVVVMASLARGIEMALTLSEADIRKPA